MNKEIQKQWETALTSGNYIQGKGSLRKLDDKYCCLGVLCDLFIKTHEEYKWQRSKLYGIASSDMHNVYGRFFLPMPVCEWAELEHRDPVVEGETTLSELNDRGCSFKEIAEKIKML